MRRELVKKFNIRCESRAREDSLKQIMAQQSVFLDLAGNLLFKRVYVVDTLARELSFAK